MLIQLLDSRARSAHTNTHPESKFQITLCPWSKILTTIIPLRAPQRRQHRFKIDVVVADMNRDNSVLHKMFSIEIRRLGGQDVNWNRVATESIQHEEIKVL